MIQTDPLTGKRYLIVEDAPADAARSYVEQRTVLHDEYADLPETFAAALVEMVDNDFDSAACKRCGNHVGYGLDGDADQYTRWTLTTLLETFHPSRQGDPTFIRLCEDCTPEPARPDLRIVR